MKFLLISLTIIGMALAQQYQSGSEQQAQIQKYSSELNPDGSFNYQYETTNGIYEDRQGYPKAADLLALQGQYQFKTPEGEVIHIQYTADENGFQPKGAHLPTPPPIPAAIQRSLDYIASQRSNVGREQGQYSFDVRSKGGSYQ